MSVRHLLAFLLVVALALMVVGTAVAPESLVYMTLGVCLATPVILRSRRFRISGSGRYLPYALVGILGVFTILLTGSMTFLIAFTVGLCIYGFATSPPTRTSVASIHRRAMIAWTTSIARIVTWTERLTSPSPPRAQHWSAGTS